ncbi:MAG: hypothetical protein KDA41_00055, partial [Planctomycetales bacterium]|nr:hypothetical protein [Planctomycetales bacterium]
MSRLSLLLIAAIAAGAQADAKPKTTPVAAPPAKTVAEPPKAAAPAAPQVDADFALQGEYMGQVASGRHAGRVGLQVVALGEGKFDAVVYAGGLPGNGWSRGDRTPYA